MISKEITAGIDHQGKSSRDRSPRKEQQGLSSRERTAGVDHQVKNNRDGSSEKEPQGWITR